VLKFNLTNDTSSYGLTTNKFLFEITHTLTFQLNPGTNTIIFPYPLYILKGQMIMINTSTANLLSINKKIDILYPDFYFQDNKLFELSWSIYFKCLIDQKFYMNIYEYTKVFIHNEQNKQFSLTAGFSNSSYDLNRNFIISNYKYSDFNCYNSNKTVNNSLDCTALLVSQAVSEFNVEHTDCTNQKLKNNFEDFFDGFGSFIQINSSQKLKYSKPFSHILSSSSEVLLDSNLIGFELSSYSSCSVKINLWSSNECNGQSCFYFFTQRPYFSATKLNSWNFDLEEGFNRILFDTYYPVVKNTFFSVETEQRLAMFNTETNFYSDFYINGTRLNPILENKLFFKALVDTGFYMSLVKFEKVNHPGVYQINIDNKKKNFTITNHKSIEIFCPYIQEYDLECFVSILSQAPDNQIFIDYGDCSNQIFSSESKTFVNFFGYHINETNVKEINSITDEKEFLILNSEFKYETELIGFEIFSTKSGFVNLQFISTVNCGSMIPCSTFLKENQFITNILPESDIIRINLKNGLHIYTLRQSKKIKKGSILILSHNDNGRIGFTEFNNLMNHTDFILIRSQNNLLKGFNNNSRFLINSLINTWHYIDTFKFNKTYPIFNLFYLKLKCSF
ncbi:unnamed protein product, partial [Brachionus calyciflorus]